MCLKRTVIACGLTMLANLLPMPFSFVCVDMKDGAKRVSAYMAKSFIGSVNYYRGSEKTVLIERRMKNTGVVEKQIGGLGDSIACAYWEGFDIGILGKVRFLHEQHNGLFGHCCEIVKALQIAMSTEDFASSHKALMGGMGEESRLMKQRADSRW